MVTLPGLRVVDREGPVGTSVRSVKTDMPVLSVSARESMPDLGTGEPHPDLERDQVFGAHQGPSSGQFPVHPFCGPAGRRHSVPCHAMFSAWESHAAGDPGPHRDRRRHSSVERIRSDRRVVRSRSCSSSTLDSLLSGGIHAQGVRIARMLPRNPPRYNSGVYLCQTM